MDDMPCPVIRRNQILLAILVGLAAGVIAVYLSYLSGGDAGDFRYCLLPARDWLAGKNPYLPYILNLDPIAVPYPFTGILLAIPFTWMPDRIVGGLFTGLGSGMLAWYILGRGANWNLLLFLSWPFMNSLAFTQWAPHLASMFFSPSLMFLALVKPQLALPYIVIQKPNRKGLFLAALLLLLSVILYPTWPVDWLNSIKNYKGSPPLFTLPLGPLLLLALIRYRDKRAWLLVLLAAMPQRMVYDQLGVLLVAGNRRQMLFLVICSWISLPLLFYFNGWVNMPWAWKQWVLIESYLPALLVVLWPILQKGKERMTRYFVNQ